MAKWLIAGASGMLGQDLQKALAAPNDVVVGLSHRELDITERDAVLAAVEEHRPDVIINAAAYTRVDDCETNEALAVAINGTGVKHLADAANQQKALLVQVSTDFVFNGLGKRPYETSDQFEPLSAYGRSKLAGELAAQSAAKHLIIRTSWLFGAGGWNFVEAMRRQVQTGHDHLKVVNDQRGKPTYTPHLADAMVRLARVGSKMAAARGTFHYADDEACTWYDFAVAIFEELDALHALRTKVTVEPVSTDQFPRPARRPAYSVLSTALYTRVTGANPGKWREGLREYLGSTGS